MKLRPNEDSELTRLKRLSPEERAEIFAWAFPTASPGEAPPITLSNAEIRSQVAARFNIFLKRDGQLSVFWPWQRRQAQWDRLGEIAAQDEEALAVKFPNVSREKLRDATIKRAYAVADLEADAGFGLQVVKVDLKESTSRLDWERFATETCELFLKWFKDKKARDIAESTVGNAEKIAALRQIYFADVDALQKSGQVKLPD